VLAFKNRSVPVSQYDGGTAKRALLGGQAIHLMSVLPLNLRLIGRFAPSHNERVPKQVLRANARTDPYVTETSSLDVTSRLSDCDYFQC
jgi:hypothetical protein